MGDLRIWLTSLAFNHQALTSLVLGSSQVHVSMMDSLRICPDMTLVVKTSKIHYCNKTGEFN